MVRTEVEKIPEGSELALTLPCLLNTPDTPRQSLADLLIHPQDDPDCLLCAEPLDLSDLNFKPCQCGMQVGLDILYLS